MKRVALFILAIIVIASNVFGSSEVEVISAIHYDVSPPLKSIPPAFTQSSVKHVVPNARYKLLPTADAPVSGVLDPVVQTWFGSQAIPGTLQNFDGISANGNIPPDTCGEAGRNHYVQMVNRRFAVFSKTGVLNYGPVDINTLWTGFGGLCETRNHGDPVVVYDQLADRWLISQFAYPEGSPSQHQECVAVSTTDDPAGSYYRYSFSFPYFNDYPKIGVWPDGYFSTYILRNPNFSVVTGRICAFNRSNMLTGAAATAQCFDVGKDYIGLLPADLDGITPPPAGSSHYSMNLSSTMLNLWKFKVNWTTPSASTLTGPVPISVAAFTPACDSTSSRVCIPQPNTTQKLDSFSDRLMFRLSYRYFGSHESLVVNHSVETSAGIAAIRWYEVRSPKTTPVMYQQGTYSPSTTHRWMGSIATDLNGNMGLGYSVSSSSVRPGIRYAGRLVTDAKNTLPQGEGTIMNGAGSQTGYNRWGDYSDLTVDPVDDCTFWYTTEYLPADGNFNWRTRIASFRFPSCGCAAPAGLNNNTAVDANVSADSGVNITWTIDAANWGDNAVGSRTYDVLRNGNEIASAVPYGTSTYNDNTGTNGLTYTYAIRYLNGCGQTGQTTGVSAADRNCTSGSQLLKNPGFESGRTLWTASPTTIINNTNGTYPPFAGNWKATLNGKGITNTATLYQQITVPSASCSATLTFRLRVATAEVTTTSAKDKLKIEVLNSSGQVLAVLATYSNLNKSSTYWQKSFNLSGYIGTTIRIRFNGSEDSSRQTSFLIDDTAVNIVQ